MGDDLKSTKATTLEGTIIPSEPEAEDEGAKVAASVKAAQPTALFLGPMKAIGRKLRFIKYDRVKSKYAEAEDGKDDIMVVEEIPSKEGARPLRHNLRMTDRLKFAFRDYEPSQLAAAKFFIISLTDPTATRYDTYYSVKLF